MFNNKYLVVMLLLLAFGFNACDKPKEPTVDVTPELNISVSTSAEKVLLGEKITVTIKAEPAESFNIKDVTYEFAKSNIFAVSEETDGFVLTAKNAGSTDLTVTYGDFKWEGKLTVILFSGKNTVALKGGEFSMGDPSASSKASNPSWKPTLSPFVMSTTEVTQKQWKAVMGKLQKKDGTPINEGDEATELTFGQGDNFPVYFVSWYDALVFCNKLSMAEGKTPCYKLKDSTDPSKWGDIPAENSTEWDNVECNWDADGYRLPTEAEWEYSARGGDKYLTYSGIEGSTVEDLKLVGWYKDNSGNKTHEVASLEGNKNDIKDMSGNVQEWCWDWSNGKYPTEVTQDPKGAATHGVTKGTSDIKRVVRGGFFKAPNNLCYVHYRMNGQPDSRSETIGFRVVRKGK